MSLPWNTQAALPLPGGPQINTGGIFGGTLANFHRLIAKYTTAQTDTVLLAVATGFQFLVTEVSAFVDHATTVDVQALFEFDDTADVRFAEHPGIAPGSGFVESAGAGLLAVGASGQDVLVTVTVPTTGSIVVAVSGFLVAV